MAPGRAFSVAATLCSVYTQERQGDLKGYKQWSSSLGLTTLVVCWASPNTLFFCTSVTPLSRNCTDRWKWGNRHFLTLFRTPSFTPWHGCNMDTVVVSPYTDFPISKQHFHEQPFLRGCLKMLWLLLCLLYSTACGLFIAVYGKNPSLHSRQFYFLGLS